MTRHARIVIPGVEHHVTRRGNYRQDVFFANNDHKLYLELFSGELPSMGRGRPEGRKDMQQRKPRTEGKAAVKE